MCTVKTVLVNRVITVYCRFTFPFTCVCVCALSCAGSLDKKGVKGKESKGGKKTAGGDQPPETPPPVSMPRVC